ncbi:MAG: DUF5916 domain-containing protein [Vicinamibacterales bacterium]
MMRGVTVAGATALLLALSATSLWAQASEPGTTSPQQPASAVVTPAAAPFPGPPPPELPETVSRDDQGRATVRAVRLTTPIRVDGRLDELVYQTVKPAGGFIQTEPKAGVPATESTEVWVTFDNDAVYVTFRCYESEPGRMVLNEMRRDSFNLLQNDGIGFVLDTYHDRRNAVSFVVTPLGGRMDGQISNERQYNADWNPIWRFATGRFDGGWTVETAIPFKSLRYQPTRQQTWGFQVNRRNRWKNELSYLSSIPNSLGQRGIFQISMAPTLVGIEAPVSGARTVEIKPYAIGDITTNLDATPQSRNDPSRDFGVDFKYGVTQNVTTDFTYNTDFAQVEADEQQVNLTRFSLFFPEKREFFLENQGVFQFGAGNFGGGGGGGGGGGFSAPSEAPILFYSRRIGLDAGREIPIETGGRLSGRIGRFSLGLLDIQTDRVTNPTTSQLTPKTNFSVVRLKRDLFRRSSIGVLATRRSHASAAGATGDNLVYGVDATFAFFTNLSINTYWAQTKTEGLSGADDVSYQAQLEYQGDRYGVQLERLTVGDNFNPEVGFVRRDDMRRNFALVRFSPRPRPPNRIRKLYYTGSLAYIEDGRGRLSTREAKGEFQIEFQNSDRFSLVYTDSYEFIPVPFAITPRVSIPVGSYAFGIARASFQLGQQRPVSGTIEAERGTFFGGDRSTVAYSRGRIGVSTHFAIEPGVSFNWVDLPVGSFLTTLATSRVTYTMTPFMFASALVQYNNTSNRVSVNARFRWEYRPGSELFVVLNEERDTLSPRFPTLRNRSVVIKVNRLFRL